MYKNEGWEKSVNILQAYSNILPDILAQNNVKEKIKRTRGNKSYSVARSTYKPLNFNDLGDRFSHYQQSDKSRSTTGGGYVTVIKDSEKTVLRREELEKEKEKILNMKFVRPVKKSGGLNKDGSSGLNKFINDKLSSQETKNE